MTLEVWVDPPYVDGDRVLFSWGQSAPNPYQRANEFWFRYEGIDLSSFTIDLWHEIFLAMQLRVFAGFGEPVEIHFAAPVPAPSIAYWQAFHDADQVTLGPIAGVDTYQPISKPIEHRQCRAAIFYGGGKDSMLSTGMLTELYGDDQVLLIQYVAPITPTAGAMAMHERRQERHMLAPVRRLRNVATQRVFTNFLANLTETGIKLRPHRQFYTVGALPVMLTYGVRESTFGDNRTDFAILRKSDGGYDFKFPGSRPEVLAAQTKHYQRVLQFDHVLNNITFPYATDQNQLLLIKRYPELLPATVPCTHGNSSERFCHRCYKCLVWAIWGLGAGYIEPQIDYDRLLTQNEWALRLVNHAETGVELTQCGNAPWVPGLVRWPMVYQGICHALAVCDPAPLLTRLGPEARANLYTMLAMYGNTRFDNIYVVAREIIDFVGTDLIRKTSSIAAEHYPVVDRLSGPWFYSNRESIIDFTTRMPTRMDKLPHLQD